MHSIAAIFGLVIIFAVLLDAFETVVLPRRITRQFRLTAWFYRNTWIPWMRLAKRINSTTRRESFLGYFGPLSLIVLLVFWALGLIFGFALLQYGTGEHVRMGNEAITFPVLLYHSGETFFTLGYGDITPDSPVARARKFPPPRKGEVEFKRGSVARGYATELRYRGACTISTCSGVARAISGRWRTRSIQPRTRTLAFA